MGTMTYDARLATTLCVHELFERQAARTPDAVALVCGGRQLSYRQLDERSNRLARYLRRRGVGPDGLVGVALERTPELVVALLGVLKAGGAYVPLDPHYPPERLAFMTRDAELRILLTDRASRPLFAAVVAEAICLDADWPLIELERPEAPVATVTTVDLAYVMYTSGSSGQPKGAMIEHGGLSNYLCWAVAAYGFTRGGRVPLHSSISFDLTVTSLFPPLLVGGCVELLADDAAAQNLLAALRSGTHYDVVKITPAHLELLGRQLAPGEMAGMSRAFVIGGEALRAESLRSWRRHAPTTRFFNEYGPTETVVGCCVHEVLAGDADSGMVPIGRAIADTRLHVLDAALAPVADGVAGELYIGGAGVARGYLNRPHLTQERFVADPFAVVPGARLYKTGDLVCRRADGVLDYLGRSDGQVKVNGYRIEPGEIEAQLAAHAEVQGCAVVAPEIAPGERQLVAYVVSAAPLQAGALNDFLARRLPAFMLPARFVAVDALPLTANGKVDRPALLAAFAGGSAAASSASAPPRTPVERQVAAIWSELLNVERIGVDDDLFDLGARSLQAVRAVTQIRSAFAVDLQLRHLFEKPTVAGLAGVVDSLRWLAQPSLPASGNPTFEEIAL